MATVTVCSDFGAQENKVCHCFHFSPIYPHEVMGPDAMIFIFWMLSFKPAFHSPLSSSGSLVPFCFLPLKWYHLYIWGCWYFSQQSWFQLVLHPAWHFVWCSLHMRISRVTIYSLGVLTPFPIWNQSVFPCPVLTVASWPAYRFLRRQVIWSSIPISLRIFHSFYCDLRSQKLKCSQWSSSRCFCGILLHFLWSNVCCQFDLWFLCLF